MHASSPHPANYLTCHTILTISDHSLSGGLLFLSIMVYNLCIMETIRPDGLTVRFASKAILVDPDGRIAFAVNGRGRRNLFGGGIDPGESPLEAAKRELAEEGVSLDSLSGGLQPVHGTAEGLVSQRSGEPLWAEWTLFAGRLRHPVKALRPQSEIDSIVGHAFYEAISLRDPDISILALDALALAVRQYPWIDADN